MYECSRTMAIGAEGTIIKKDTYAYLAAAQFCSSVKYR